MAETLLDKAGIKYTKVMVEEDKEMFIKYGIKDAGTVMVVKDGVTNKYDNAGLNKYLREAK